MYSDVNTWSGYAAEQGTRRVSGNGVREAAVLPQYPGMRVERENGLRVLVVEETPEKLWPRLKEFVFSLGLTIHVENKASGMIETNWAENKADRGASPLKNIFGRFSSTDLQDRYRIRIERANETSTRVYVTHQGMEEIVVSGAGDSIVQTKWQPRGPEPELEAEMLRLLMIQLGQSDGKARALLASGVARSVSTVSRGESGEVRLTINAGLDYAWRRVGVALDRLGVSVDDRDRGNAVYSVRVSDSKEKKSGGFLNRLFSKDDARVEATAYRVKLAPGTAGTTVVQLLDAKDKPVRNEAGREFVRSLHTQLQ
jgi:outer membrane protein assembly factor BamC